MSWKWSSSIVDKAEREESPTTKRSIVANYLNTIESTTTNQPSTSPLISSLKRGAQILQGNGYQHQDCSYTSAKTVAQALNKPSSQQRILNQRLRSNIPPLTTVKLPYITDAFTIDFASTIFKHNLPIRVLPIPPPNLRKLFIRNRLYDRKCYDPKQCIICKNNKLGDCCKKDVVYSIECLECGDLYIGETGRFLHKRIHEHILSMRTPFLVSHINCPLAKHVTNRHNAREVEVKVCLEARGDGNLIRKIREAHLIQSRQPAINGCVEAKSLQHFLAFEL